MSPVELLELPELLELLESELLEPELSPVLLVDELGPEVVSVGPVVSAPVVDSVVSLVAPEADAVELPLVSEPPAEAVSTVGSEALPAVVEPAEPELLALPFPALSSAIASTPTKSEIGRAHV